MSPYIGNKERVRGDRPPALRAPGEKATAEPTPEPQEPQEAAEVPPNPTAVGYRTAAETCGNCSYMQGDFCTFPLVAQTVAGGDSCAAFEAKTSGQSPEPSMGGEYAD